MAKLGRDGTAGSTGGSRASGGIEGPAGKNVSKINRNGSAAPVKNTKGKRTLKEMKEFNQFVTSMNAKNRAKLDAELNAKTRLEKVKIGADKAIAVIRKTSR